MSSKGGSNKNKRVSLPKARHVLRKRHTWAIRPIPGPHNQKMVLPLGEIIRDKLGLASNRKEIRAVLSGKGVLVDEKPRTDSKFPVGLFDIVRIEAEKKRFRVVFDSKGRLQLREMDSKEKAVKVCRIVRKKVLGKEQVQLTTHDGRTFIEKAKTKAKTGDSLVIELPSQKIVETISLEKGKMGYIFSGIHAGTPGKIVGVMEGTIHKDALVEMQTNQETVQALRENIIVIGEKEPVIEIAWNKSE
jgi:small subunit ribosomal protein S4e